MPITYHTIASTMTVTTRNIRLVLIFLKQSMPVKTVSMPAVGVHAHGGQQRGGRQDGGDVAEGAGDVVAGDAQADEAVGDADRVASHAPSAISHTAEPDAAEETAVMIPGEASRGM